jgi:hypothetical protein
VGSPVTINFRAKNLEKAKHLGRWVILRPKTDTTASTSNSNASSTTASAAATATAGDSAGGLNDEVCHLDSVVLQQQWLCLASRSPAAATLVSCGPTDNGKAISNSNTSSSASNSSGRVGQWTTAGGTDDVACTWRIHLVTLPVSQVVLLSTML